MEIRQCGKTRSIEQFGKENYENVVEINFWNNPEYCKDFDRSLDVDTLISNISLRFPTIEIKPKNTLLIFDEIQECPRARLAFKNFKIDGRYDVIGSGSYLEINGYVDGDSTPAPTGYEEVYNMHTMDFEEFLWANNYKDKDIEKLYEYFKSRKAVPENIHEMYKNLFNQYICVGGFPRTVIEYLDSQNCFRINSNIVFDMKSDFGRRLGKDGQPVFKPSEVARIQNAFDLIPTFLAKENKRYVTSKITGGSSFDKVGAIEYLRQSHIVHKVFLTLKLHHCHYQDMQYLHSLNCFQKISVL